MSTKRTTTAELQEQIDALGATLEQMKLTATEYDEGIELRLKQLECPHKPNRRHNTLTGPHASGTGVYYNVCETCQDCDKVLREVIAWAGRK